MQDLSATLTTLPRPKLRLRGLLREILDTIILIGAIYALVNLVSVRFIVEGPSMQPNFYTGQVLVVSRLHYMMGNPQRGDIVVFNPPNQPADEPPYIKRIIGLPGDKVEIRETLVYVNDVLIEEPYINEPCRSSMCPDGSWQLGENEYFVMGDNRNHSSDSRRFGPITSEAIIGEALIRYWPPADWGLVNRIAYPGDAP
ncbi:MAG: signal peptidase I [Chloroflexi bacterium]|nr:signal peptidase I [Chloroflexota bacterium]